MSIALACLDGTRAAPSVAPQTTRPAPRLWDVPLTFRGERPDPWRAENALGSYRSWVYAAASRIGTRIAELEVYLEAIRPDGTASDVLEHPFLATCRRPNPVMTWQLLAELTSIWLDLVGAAYWLKIRGPLGVPVMLWPLPPQLTKPVTSDAMPIAGFNFYRDGIGSTPLFFPASEVVYVRQANPRDPIMGWSTIRAAAYEIDAQTAMQVYESAWFKNAARPDYVVTTKIPPGEKGQADFNRLWAQIALHHRGANHYGEPLVLPDGSAVEVLSFSSADSQFLERSNAKRDDILAVLKTPRFLLGFSDAVNRATADSILYLWNLGTIAPRVALIFDAINAQLVETDYQPGAGIRLRAYTENPVPEDRVFDLEETRVKVEAGIWTRDEAREEDGLDPVEGGDVLLVSAGLVPLADAAMRLDAKPSDVAPASSAKQNAPAPTTRAVRAPTMKPADIATPEARVLFWRRADATTSTLERSMSRGMRVFFRRQAERVLKGAEQKLEGMRAQYAGHSRRKVRIELQTREIGDEFLTPEEEDELRKAMRPYVNDAVQRGGKSGAKLVGIDWDARNPKAERWLSKHLSKVVGDITDTTRNAITKTISAGIQDGEQASDLVKRIQAVFADADERRAYVIARTETTGAFGAGNQLSFEDPAADGIVTGKAWISSRDDRVRDTHQALDGDEVNLTEDFSNGCGFPGDPRGAASEVVNCRCVLAPVLGA